MTTDTGIPCYKDGQWTHAADPIPEGAPGALGDLLKDLGYVEMFSIGNDVDTGLVIKPGSVASIHAGTSSSRIPPWAKRYLPTIFPTRLICWPGGLRWCKRARSRPLSRTAPRRMG